jgi:NADH-quinone oxidoreductase subunit G
LLDAGRASDGDENLAATAKPARAIVSAATAAEYGVVDGDAVQVSTPRGSVTVPVSIGAVLDRVVWLPTNARGCQIRVNLGVTAGALVSIRRAEVTPS